MHKLALVLDSSSGIKNGEFEHVYVVPLIINEDVGGKITPYKDNVDIDSNSLSKKLIEGANIKTSQSSIGENMQLLEDLTSKYEKVVVVPIPSTISGNLQSWQMLAKEYPEGKITCIDQHMLSIPTQWWVKDIAPKLKKQTLTVEEVKKVVENSNSSSIIALVVPDLKFLIKGGRIKRLAGAIGTFLKMKVVISLFKDGLVYYSKTLKASNIPEIVDQMFEEKLQYKNKKIKRIGLISSEINEEKYNIESLKEAMLKYFNVRKCDKGVVPAAIMAHTGPNYLGFCIEVEE